MSRHVFEIADLDFLRKAKNVKQVWVGMSNDGFFKFQMADGQLNRKAAESRKDSETNGPKVAPTVSTTEKAIALLKRPPRPPRPRP